MKTYLKEFIPYLLVAIFCLLAGFAAGRKSVDMIVESVTIEQGDPMRGSVTSEQFVPTSEVIPSSPILPFRILFVKDREVQVVDTTAILADYEKQRRYTLTAFDNKEQGKLLLMPTVQYNMLQALDYEFTPVVKTVTKYRQRALMPFVSAGWSSLEYVGVGGGFFYHKLGIEYMYLKGYRNKQSAHLVSGKIAF